MASPSVAWGSASMLAPRLARVMSVCPPLPGRCPTRVGATSMPSAQSREGKVRSLEGLPCDQAERPVHVLNSGQSGSGSRHQRIGFQFGVAVIGREPRTPHHTDQVLGWIDVEKLTEDALCREG